MTDTRPAILIADDNEFFRDVFRDLLSAEGFEVECADDGGPALAILKGNPARRTLVLLDLVMPGIDGFEVIETLRREDALANVRILVITGLRNRPEDRMRVSGPGVIGFLGKDVSPSAIVERVISLAKAWT
ncbi:MAG: response regulator [Deltaproteobacteria bacterium]|nr:response regulator [Deltaproteobacteria bacterium]